MNATRQSRLFMLRFDSLFKPGSGYAFDCDASGAVDLDDLSGRARDNHFFARTMFKHDFGTPKVVPVSNHRQLIAPAENARQVRPA